MDVAQALEDILEELVSIQKDVTKLKTASVSGQALRKRVKDTHKNWLPIAGLLETGNIVDTAQLQEVSDAWSALVKLTNNASPKTQYKPLLKLIIAKTETDLLHRFIKGSAIQTIGDTLRKLVQPVGLERRNQCHVADARQVAHIHESSYPARNIERSVSYAVLR